MRLEITIPSKKNPLEVRIEELEKAAKEKDISINQLINEITLLKRDVANFKGKT